MCTVTFIPSKDKIFLTSNRDEKHWRASALGPDLHKGKTGNLFYPKDGDHGGTWFAVHQNGNAVVFLNGGFIRHEPTPPYKKSRGLVLLDLIDSPSAINEFENIDLQNIEPFTAIIWEKGTLAECRWDGHKKYRVMRDETIPHIWSSCTLYDDEVITRRRMWFADWCSKNTAPGQNEILHFHRFTGDGDAHNDLFMNRDGKVFTVSITSASIGLKETEMKYVDTKENREENKIFEFTNATVKA